MRAIRNASLGICFLCVMGVPGVSWAAPSTSTTPSFDCAAPSLSATERQICGDAELAGYDRELSGIYDAEAQATPDKPALVQGQRAWLQKRNACGVNLDCIRGAYLTRIYELQTNSPASGATGDQAQRVNTAIPLSSDAQNALSAMRRRVNDKKYRAGIESQLALKMKLRAFTCIQSLVIPAGLSNQEIHDRYAGSPCFAQQDDDIAGWLGLRVVGYLLTLPPLRPMPATPPLSVADGMSAAITKVYFASQAGIVAFQSQTDVEVVDLTTGAPTSTQIQPDGPLLGISPNGRVYVTQDDRRPGRLRFMDSTDASPIADPVWYQYTSDFVWLDPQTTFTRDPIHHAAALYDFASGSLAPLENGLPYFWTVTSTPGTGGSFLGLSNSGITEFRVIRDADDIPHIQVVRNQQQGKQKVATYGVGGVMPGGRQFIYVSDGRLAITDLSDLHTDYVVLGGLYYPMIVVPTSDPDKVIVGGSSTRAEGGRSAQEMWREYAYALKEQTLTLLDVQRDLAGNHVGDEFYYDSPSGALYLVANPEKNKSLTRVDSLNWDPPIPLATFAADTQEWRQEKYMPKPVVPPYSTGWPAAQLSGTRPNQARINMTAPASTSLTYTPPNGDPAIHSTVQTPPQRVSTGTPGTWSYTAPDGTVVSGSGQPPQPAQASVDLSSTACPQSMDGYKPGETTLAEVEHCLGKATHQYHNVRDGTYGDIYNLPDGDVYLFQFDRSMKLMVVRKAQKCLNPPCVVAPAGP